jgi:hypothetical protein
VTDPTITYFVYSDEPTFRSYIMSGVPHIQRGRGYNRGYHPVAKLRHECFINLLAGVGLINPSIDFVSQVNGSVANAALWGLIHCRLLDTLANEMGVPLRLITVSHFVDTRERLMRRHELSLPAYSG